MKGFHGPVLRLPRLVQLGAVNDDNAAIRVGYKGELVVGIACVERDVVEKGGRPGHDALWECVDVQHSLGVDVEEDQFSRTCAVPRTLALASALLVSHVLKTKLSYGSEEILRSRLRFLMVVALGTELLA